MERVDRKILVILVIILATSFFFDKAIIDLITPISLASTPLHFFVSYGFIFILLAALSVYFYKLKKPIIPIWLSPFIGGVLSVVVKLITGRPRFFAEKFLPLGIPDYSFPSSHISIVFALLPFLIKQTKNIRWVWLTYGMLIVISRILLKQHYFSDIMGGVLLGYSAGLIALYLHKRFIKNKNK